jgi:hypothetical protein
LILLNRNPKVTIQPNGSQSFTAEAGVGIFGTQLSFAVSVEEKSK